jgi:hypothetical protein
MYAVVGCRDCANLWLLSDPAASETATCPRCGTRRQTKKLRRLFESEDREAARQARAKLLADKQDAGDAFDEVASVSELEWQVEESGIDDREYLEGSGLDPDEVEAAGEQRRRPQSRNRTEVVRDALRESDRPTEAAVVEYATENGVPAEAARQTLEKLTRAGEVSESGGRYRLL